MGANTTCKDFLAASQADRDVVVLRLAADLHNPGVTSPLGRPDVEFNCAEKPDRLLGDVVRTSDNPGASPSQSSEPSTEPMTVDPSMPGWTPEAVILTDDQGYKYQYKVAAQLTSQASNDVSNAPPGQTDWTQPTLQMTLTITNLTPGRNGVPYGVGVDAYWTTTVEQCAGFSGAQSIALPNGKVFCPLASAAAGGDDATAQLGVGESKDYVSAMEASSPLRMTEANAAALTALSEQPPEGWSAGGHVFKENPEVAYISPDNGSGTTFHFNTNMFAQQGMPKPCKDLGC